MKWFFAAKQVKSREQTHKSEEVIAVKVAYKNMMEIFKTGVIFNHLHLCAFAAINKKALALVANKLCRGVLRIRGYCRTIS